MYKFVRTKSHIGSKFSKIFFEQLYTGWIVVVHLYCSFCPWRHMAPQQNVKFGTAFFGQFRISLRIDSVANASFWTRFFSTFSTSLTLDPAGMHCPSRGDAFVSSCPWGVSRPRPWSRGLHHCYYYFRCLFNRPIFQQQKFSWWWWFDRSFARLIALVVQLSSPPASSFASINTG